jgi:FkbM family methyltransferase
VIVYDWVNRSKFFVKTGETGLTGNIYTGLHELPEMGFLLHFLRDTDFFVDVGANVGSYTILACSAIGARGCAIEPVASTYRRLVENIRLNHMEERVQCFNIGVGNKSGSVRFTGGLDTVNHVVALNEYSENTINVEISTLDIILKYINPSLIKIDVEGYETPGGGIQRSSKQTTECCHHGA